MGTMEERTYEGGNNSLLLVNKNGEKMLNETSMPLM